MRSKQLLMLSNKFPSRKKVFIGGDFVKEELDIVKEAFNEVKVVSPIPRSLKMRIDDKHCKNYTYENVHVYFPRFFHLPIGYFRNRLGDNYFKTINTLIKKKNIEFNIIHAHFAWPSGYAGMKLKEKYEIPLVVTAHGYDIYDVPFRNDTLRKKIKYTLRSADQVITVSKANLKYIKKLDESLDPKVIPNGYNDDLFYPIPKKMVRRKLGLPVDKKIVLSVGNLVEVKGHNYLIHAMKEVVRQRKDVVCVIVGTGPQKKELENLIEQLQLQDHVQSVGAKPHEEIPLWMNACDIFVLPSVNEGNPTVMFEALGCGTPCVGTRVGGIPEIIDEGSGVLIDPKNSEKLAWALERAIERDWNKKKIVEYSKKYRWKKISRKMVKIYRKIFA